MRKITRLAALAFRHQRNFNMGNTSVTNDSGFTQLRLHDNLIAERQHKVQGLSSVRVTLAGWNTPTTRERVNGLLDMLGASAYFYQRQFEAKLTIDGEDYPVQDDQWITIDTHY